MSSLGSPRDSFLARVRQAAEAGRSYRVHCMEVPDAVGYVGGGDDLCATLAREINDVGGRAVIAEGWNQAKLSLTQILRSFEPRTAIRWRHPVLDRLDLDQILGQLKIECHDYDTLRSLSIDEQRTHVLAADLGITSATSAIAETGTLLMAAGPGQERIVSLLPPIHLAVVSESQIVPDLFDALAQVHSSRLPSAVTLITGPSKTGDIELQLTTGVHGPGKWQVLIVRE